MLFAKKVKISDKYSDIFNVFSEKKALILPEIIKLNQNTIKLQKSQQPLYRPIYSLGLVELKILKAYIEINLTNSFIYFFKFYANVFTFFV